jgi:hypothetical protein
VQAEARGGGHVVGHAGPVDACIAIARDRPSAHGAAGIVSSHTSATMRNDAQSAFVDALPTAVTSVLSAQLLLVLFEVSAVCARSNYRLQWWRKTCAPESH